MARKRKADLRALDPTSALYWEEVLQRAGLPMSRGRNERMIYVGGASQVELVHGMHETDTGRVESNHED
jgi:hypothetical protein